MKERRFTPEVIENLDKSEIFVFGSNIQGEHVGGAAYVALKKFGANMGQGFGFQGRSYAIPTCIRLTKVEKDGSFGVRFTKPFENANDIKPYVEVFINDAKQFPTFTFLVTKIGCGIAGFEKWMVAELFRPCLYMDNVVLPKEFVDYLER